MTLKAAPAGDRWVRASTGSALLVAMAVLVGCGGGESSSADPIGQASAGRMRAMAVASAGSTYYVDAGGGNDSNTGSAAAPWKSLARVARQSLAAGDVVLLRCGGIWRESWIQSASNTADGVSFGNYGTGCSTSRPRVLGSDDFSGGWTKTGNVWSRKVPAGTPKIARLFVDGVAQRLAQWPNHSDAAGYASVDAATAASTTQFKLKAADVTALTGKDLVGATVYVRSVAWNVDPELVTAYSDGAVTVGNALAYPIGSTTEYVLTDKAWMVDSPGEYYHDTVNNIIYLYPSASSAQANLNAYGVEGAVRDYAATFSGRSSLQVKGISFERARLDGLLFSEAPGAVASDILANGNGRNGVRVYLSRTPSGTTRGLSLDASAVSDNGENGVHGLGAFRVDVSNSVITDTGTNNVAGNSLAAVLVGPGSKVVANVIRNAAYIGIRYSGTGGSQVDRNIISGHCARLTDCGAIYSWNGPKATRATAEQSAIISNNVVQDTASRRRTSISGGQTVVGIYLDDFTLGATVSGNMVLGGPVGLLIHNGSNHVVSGNIFQGNTSASIWMSMDQTDADYMSSNLIQNNTVLRSATVTGTYPALPAAAAGNVVLFQHATKGSASITSGSNIFNGNQVKLLNTGPAAFARVGTMTSVTTLDAVGWRGLAGSVEPVPSAQRFVTYMPMLSTELMTNGGFSNGLFGWSSSFVSNRVGGVFGLLPSHAGCVGACLQFNNLQISDYVMSSPFLLTSGKLYQMRAKAVMRSNAALIAPYIGKTTMPYASYAMYPGVTSLGGSTGVVGDVVDYTGVFRASTTASAMSILRISPEKASVAFDDVSLREVTAYTIPAQTELWRTVVAESDPVTVTCTSLGWAIPCVATDIDGNAVTLPLTVPARSAKVLLRGGGIWAYQ